MQIPPMRWFACCVLLFAACTPPMPPAPKAGRLQAGIATRRIDAPVGTALGGYLRTAPRTDPGSPWAKQLPASQGVHTEPTVRALVLTNGLTRVAMVRLDSTLTSPTLRSRVVALTDTKVLLYATHSHAAPARIMPPAHIGGPGGSDFVSLVMDHYDAELEERLAARIIEAITDAEANLRPVAVSTATIDASDFNNDRRCENDPLYGPGFRDTDVTVIRLDETDGSGAPVKPFAALLHYAMHGTVLGDENTLQSTEAPGALELYASDVLGVPAMYVQGAAGDVSPADDAFHHDALQRLERQGRAQAELVKQAFERATPGTAPAEAKLAFFERGVTVSREAIGYARGDYAEGGALQCAAGGPGNCGAVVSEPKDVVCLPLERRPAFKTAVSMVRIGDDVAFLSLPGEPGTGLSRKMQQAMMPLGVAHALVVGYAQDHYGYLLEEDDWLRGGYEPTVSAWGWKFGPYLLSQVNEFVETIDQPQDAPDLITTFLQDAGPRVPAAPLHATHVITEPLDGERLTTHHFVFEGADPSLGLPQVALEKEEAGAFTPVMASATRAVVNGPELLLRYDATPTFKADPGATTREHRWSVSFETVPSTPTGTYRFKVGELISRPFVVTASTAIVLTAHFTADGRIAIESKFPPNPTVFDATGNVIEHYRVRDMNADPAIGARALGAEGATFVASINGAPATFTWDAASGAWRSEPMTAGGAYAIDVTSLTDSGGNGLSRPMSLMLTR